MSDPTHATLARVGPGEKPQRMHPLVSAAISTGSAVDPQTLRELLAVQREWEAGEARKAYTRAMAALKRDLPTVIRRDQVVDFKTKSGRTYYTHTSLAAVMDAITEPLTQYGFSLAWTPAIGERNVKVTCRLTHTEGHFEEATLEAPPDTSGNKNPAQAIASTVTLLQRYTALSVLGIATADMKEPTGEPADPSTVVNPELNLRAAAWAAKRGKSRVEAEKHLGKAIAEWTAADLEKLKAWAKPADPNEPAEGEAEEEGED